MFPVILFVSVLIDVLNIGSAVQHTETILTSGGSLRGEEVETQGIKYKAFRGIPYAAPPIGELRFKDPQPLKLWDNVKDAIEFGHHCFQGFKANNHTLEEVDSQFMNQDEDCLTLNVYSKKLGTDADQPVLFVISGNRFFDGDGTDAIFGPEFLVDQDIVVVTFNYRLGPLGFLATNTADAPGNWGLKDQVAALKWVQENIAQFGGDQKHVTLFGHSAGAVSAHLHTMSHLSQGLFDKAILSSGTANSIWAMTYDQERYSENLAKKFGASKEQVKDPGKRVQFLRGVDAKNLSQNMWLALDEEDFLNNLGVPIPFLPVLEPEEMTDCFITNDPIEFLGLGTYAKVPLMIGFNDNEAGFELISPRLHNETDQKELDKDLCVVLPQYLRKKINEEQDCPKVTEEIRAFYFGGKSIVGQKENMTDLLSDALFVNEIVFAENLLARESKEGHFVYNYYFTYDGEWNMMKEILQKMGKVNVRGAVHGDDITYYFNPRVMKLPLREPSKTGLDIKARMISYTSNFVKTGNPTPAVSDLVPFLWEPAKEEELNTMVIGTDSKMEQKILKDRMQFWEDLFERYDPSHQTE